MASESRKKMAQRAVALMAVLGILFLLVTGKLFYEQIIKGAEYQSTAINQQTKELTVSARRGTIYDCNGKALAVSATAYKVVLSPSSIEKEEERAKIRTELPDILGVEPSVVEAALGRKTYYAVIARRIEPDVAENVRAFVRENAFGAYISIVDDPKRYYPYNDFACQVIGFTGDDNQGLSGLEVMYDEELSGTDGKIVRATDAVGNDLTLLDYEKYIPAVDGYDIHTTLNETIQHYLEKRLKSAFVESGLTGYAGGIVMDVKTGGILGMGIYPGFDLNAPFTVGEDWARVLDPEMDSADVLNNMWKNRLITDQYEPGSTFKSITSSIAVESGSVNDNDVFYCPGYKIVAGTYISCANHAGHGKENFQQALNNSCNPAFMDIGEMIGARTFDMYMTGFGFRSRTGIDLPGEGIGILHSLSEMGPVQLATSAFGQTFKITPIQMIAAVSAIANKGKLMQPYVVSSITDADGNVISSHEPKVVKQVISETTADKIVSMMETVVSEGGGYNAYTKGFRVCGKSGTSQKIDQVHSDGTYDYTASFIAYAPANDPQIAMLILLDEPTIGSIYGAHIAGPIVSNLMQEIMTYLGVSPQYTEEELARQDLSVPQVTGMSSTAAHTQLNKYGLNSRVIGGDGVIERQIPAAGQMIPYTGTVLLYTNGAQPATNITVPDLSGKGISVCSSELSALGLNIRIVGADPYKNEAFVFSQTPAAGASVGAGMTIEVEFRVQGAADD